MNCVRLYIAPTACNLLLVSPYYPIKHLLNYRLVSFRRFITLFSILHSLTEELINTER